MTQLEFDNEMHRISDAQFAEKKIYQDMIDKIDAQKRSIIEEIDDRLHAIHKLKDQRNQYLSKIKECNIKYHAMKHQLVVDHPKDTMEDAAEEA